MKKLYVTIHSTDAHTRKSAYELLFRDRDPKEIVAVLIPGLTLEYINPRFSGVSHCIEEHAQEGRNTRKRAHKGPPRVSMLLQWKMDPSFCPDSVRPFQLHGGRSLEQLQSTLPSARDAAKTGEEKFDIKTKYYYSRNNTVLQKQFKLSRGIRLGKILEWYADKEGIHVSKLRAVYDGCQRDPSSVMADLGIVEGEIIYILMKQIGD